MLAEDIATLLACPDCGGPLASLAGLECARCRRRFEENNGVPMLLRGSTLPPHKQRQVEFFDRADAEYEITRPHGAPRMFGWLLGEKFRRSVSALERTFAGTTVLTVCGGSGMDAEFLARAGARVMACDISLEAALRAHERARRYGVDLTPIVADVEALPFADASIDLVYVHDGLHHLEDPLAGLREMGRVANWAVSINEPVQAIATNLAIRIGLSDVEEEAGNYIARLNVDEIRETLVEAGFVVLAADRYAMFYRHEPGPISSALSREPFFSAARAGFLAFNRLLGGIGNKLTVQAIRPPRLG
jgi:SAM-dependent methyltransferase